MPVAASASRCAGLDLGRARAEAAVGGPEVERGSRSRSWRDCVSRDPRAAPVRARGRLPPCRSARRPITHPDAALLVEEVQEEYVVRYGGRDETPIDPSVLRRARRRLLRGVRRTHARSRPVPGGDATDVAGARHHGHGRDQADVRRAGTAAAAAWPGRCWRTSSRPRPRPAPRWSCSRPGCPAGGDRAVRVLRLHADPGVRLLPRRRTVPLLRPPDRLTAAGPQPRPRSSPRRRWPGAPPGRCRWPRAGSAGRCASAPGCAPTSRRCGHR